MTVKVAPASVPVRDRVGAPVAYTNPAAGVDFLTTVPAGQRWRLFGASMQLACSGSAGNRQPAFWAGVGTRPFRAKGTSQAVTAGQTRQVVFYDQELYYDTFLNNVALIGLSSIWLPPGAIVKLQVVGIQPGDQISAVNLWTETEEL